MKKDSNLTAILVLSDGDTWETLGAQSVLVLSEMQLTQLTEGHLKVRELKPLISLNILELNQENKE